MKLNYRGNDKNVFRDSVYDTPIYRYSSIDEIPWQTFIQQPDQMVRIIVSANESDLPLDVLYQPRQHRRLMVGFHGAENQNLTNLPKFQFVRSFVMHRIESLLFISDTTLLRNEKIRIGWLGGDERQDLAPRYAQLVNSLVKNTKIHETLLVGHSAGATAAIRLGTMIPNSHAVAVNGQLGGEFFYENDSTALREGAFPSIKSNLELFSSYADRFDLRETLKIRSENSTFSWFTHVRDRRNSFESNPSFPELVKHYNLPDFGGRTESDDLVALCNWETGEVDPHALPGTVIPFINAVLGEEASFDIAISGELDPQWKYSFEHNERFSSNTTNKSFIYRGMNDDYDELYQARIFRFTDANEIDWNQFRLNEKSRIIIQDSDSQLPIDVLFLPRQSTKLLVGFHGAEPRHLLNAPKFQFLNSLSTRDESILLISDSTFLSGENISIGWLTGNTNTFLANNVAEAIRSLTKSLKLTETALIGHSAGGFAAIMVGSKIANSHAICVNPQISVDLYHRWTQENLRMDAFPDCHDVETMLERYKDRMDLRSILSSREQGSKFTYYAHVEDSSSFSEFPNFPRLAEALNLNSNGGRSENGDLMLRCNWELGGASAHALPGTILPFIEQALGEDSSFDLRISDNLV